MNQYWTHCEQSHLSFVQIGQFDFPIPIRGGCSSFVPHSLEEDKTKPSAAHRGLPKLWGQNYTQALHRGLHPSRAWSMSPQPELRIGTTAAPESRTWPSFTADSGTRAVRPAPEHTENLATVVLGDEIAEKGRKG